MAYFWSAILNPNILRGRLAVRVLRHALVQSSRNRITKEGGSFGIVTNWSLLNHRKNTCSYQGLGTGRKEMIWTLRVFVQYSQFTIYSARNVMGWLPNRFKLLLYLQIFLIREMFPLRDKLLDDSSLAELQTKKALFDIHCWSKQNYFSIMEFHEDISRQKKGTAALRWTQEIQISEIVGLQSKMKCIWIPEEDSLVVVQLAWLVLGNNQLKQVRIS